MAPKLEEATTDLERLADLERANVAEADRLAVELVDIEARSGAALLDAQLAGDDTAPVLAQISDTRTRLEVAERAASAARARRCAAQLAAWALEAVPLREQAAQRRTDADAQEKAEQRALAALVKVSDCRWAPEPPRHGGPGSIVGVQTPKSAVMRIEVADLERRAEELETRKVRDAGGVYGSSVAELLAEIDALGVAMVPDRHAVREWVAQAGGPLETRIARSYAHSSLAGAQVRYELVWRGGRIDLQRSTARIVERSDNES